MSRSPGAGAISTFEAVMMGFIGIAVLAVLLSKNATTSTLFTTTQQPNGAALLKGRGVMIRVLVAALMLIAGASAVSAQTSSELLHICKTQHWGKAGLAHSRAIVARVNAGLHPDPTDENWAGDDTACGSIWRHKHHCKERPNQAACG